MHAASDYQHGRRDGVHPRAEITGPERSRRQIEARCDVCRTIWDCVPLGRPAHPPRSPARRDPHDVQPKVCDRAVQEPGRVQHSLHPPNLRPAGALLDHAVERVQHGQGEVVDINKNLGTATVMVPI